MPSNILSTTAARKQLRRGLAWLLILSGGMCTDSPDMALDNFWELAKHSPLCNSQLGLPVAMIIASFMLLAAAVARWERCKSTTDCFIAAVHYLIPRFSATVRVSESNPLYGQILQWMTQHQIGRHARKIISNGLQRNNQPSSTPLESTPDIGTYSFGYNFWRLTVHKQHSPRDASESYGIRRIALRDSGLEPAHELIISCASWTFGAWAVEQFLDNLQKAANTPRYQQRCDSCPGRLRRPYPYHAPRE